MKFKILNKVFGSGSAPARDRFAFLALVKDIQSFPQTDSLGVLLLDDIKMKENCGMMQVYLTASTQEYSYETIGESDSRSFKVKFIGSHPGTEQQALEFATNFTEKEFVVLIPQCNKGIKVLGSPDSPLIFTSSHKSSKDSEKFNLVFEQEVGGEHIYLLYDGIITLNNNIDIDMKDFLELLKDYIKLDGSNLTEAQKQNLRTILGQESKNLGNNDLSLIGDRALNLGNYFLNFFSTAGARIGINKNKPTHSLEVGGNVKTDGLIIADAGAPNEIGSIKRTGDEIQFLTSTGWETIMLKGDYVSDSHGTILPDTPIPVGGWKIGWYTPKLSSADPGTNYPNQNNLKSIKGFLTEFYFNGSNWVDVFNEIPKATQFIPEFIGSTFPVVGYVQRLYNGVIWELPLGETATASDVPGVSLKWKQAVEGNGALRQTIGVTEVPIGTNSITELVGSDLNNTALWTVGYLNKTTAPANSATFRYSTKYYPIKQGGYNFRIAIYGNAVVNYYDKDKNIIGFLERGNLSTTMWVTSSNAPVGTAFIRISHFYGNGALDGTAAGGHPTTNIYVSNQERIYSPTSDIFVLSNEFTSRTDNVLKNTYGINSINPLTEFISSLINSNLSDTTLWKPGFLRATGVVENGADWYHTKNYISLPAGTYQYRFYYTRNAKALIYDSATLQITTILNNSSSSDGHNGTFTLTEDSLIKISHRSNSTQPERIALISLKNTNVIVPKVITSFNIEEYASNKSTDLRKIYKDTYLPKQRKKIATFICDDGHINDKLWYLPLLAEYGVKSTLAISKHWVVGGEATRLNRADIIQYHKDGHDIANHTVNHLYFVPAQPALPMPLDQAESEVLENKLFLENLINDEVPMFISPFGSRNANIDFIISKYHKANFISGYAVNNPTPLDSFFINRVSFDASASGVSMIDGLKLKIDDAVVNNQWLVFAIHSGYPEYNTSNTVDRRQELRQTIEYLIAQGFEIMTARRAYSYYKNPVEIGVKRYSAKYYALGMDGIEVNTGYF